MDDGVGGEKDTSRGSVVHRVIVALEINGAAVFVDDAAADPKSQAGSALSLGSVERLKKSGFDLLSESGALVRDGDQGACLAPQTALVEAGGAGDGAQVDDGFGSGGLSRVGEQVGENLAELSRKAVDDEVGREVGFDGDIERGKAAFHQEQDRLERFLEIDGDRRLGLAVERKHGAADLGNAGDLLLGQLEEARAFFRRGLTVHEEEEVRNRIERVVNLVGDGGGEASGNSELLIGQQCFPALDGHGDVAENKRDADDLARFVANGRGGLIHQDLLQVFADEDTVFGELRNLVEPLDLGDGIFDRFARGGIEDAEDGLDWLVMSFTGGPPSELLSDVVHCVHVSFGVAGNDAVGDGLESGAQLLLGAERLLGAQAEHIVRLPEGTRDVLQLTPAVEPDDEPDENRREE